MFAQANSEHCRHKIFNASWIIDGAAARGDRCSAMIRYTHARSPAGRAVRVPRQCRRHRGLRRRALTSPTRASGIYRASARADRHPHQGRDAQPSRPRSRPFPGAATGSGGEIRDEGATGRGAKPKAGLTGFSVSNLRIPGYERPWEREFGKPARIASALEIMLEGPIGAASFNNEFGRPAICGYFRTFEQHGAGDPPQRVRGYHKPIMIAGGLGNVRRAHVEKSEVPAGREARGARRTCDAHRPRRRRGLLGRQRRLERGSGFRLRAARQPGDPAPRAGSDRSLLVAGRTQPHRAHPRRRRRRALQRGARGGGAQRARRAHRPAHHPERREPACRRWSCGATRRRSATCWRSRRRSLAAVRGDRARASAARSP